MTRDQSEMMVGVTGTFTLVNILIVLLLLHGPDNSPEWANMPERLTQIGIYYCAGMILTVIWVILCSAKKTDETPIAAALFWMTWPVASIIFVVKAWFWAINTICKRNQSPE